ncbi:bacteriorhodopsin [Rossellomorea aquimaris]|uniref:bacteriorhodopsin n=1 Tax=Rossellomorea aquimaris TaxID=189382 RepID=UPI001CD51FDE|nr:bacteriorhodopsin [Rossellomorea aquimaris]MCA1054163.1 bacteriorhodopsin [Rossellomorea aquimaris]
MYAYMNEIEVTSLWIYVVFMFSGAAVFALWSMNRKGVPKVEYLIAFFIPVWSGLAYMSMAMGQGGIVKDGGVVYFARYLDWVVTTPLLLIALALTGMHHLKKKDPIIIASLIAADVVMITTGFIADMSTGGVVFTWYLIGITAFLVILWLIWSPLRKLAKQQGEKLYKVYLMVCGYLTLFWVGYPLVWLLGPSGLGVIGQAGDTLLFVILPIFSKVGFSLLDLYQLRRLRIG